MPTAYLSCKAPPRERYRETDCRLLRFLDESRVAYNRRAAKGRRFKAPRPVTAVGEGNTSSSTGTSGSQDCVDSESSSSAGTSAGFRERHFGNGGGVLERILDWQREL